MAKRKRKLLSPVPLAKQSAPRHSETSMAVPNHMVRTELYPEDAVPNSEFPDCYELFTLLQLQKPASKGSGMSAGLVFCDDRYQQLHWCDRSGKAAPTWMDPEVFVRQVLQDPRAAAVVKAYRRQGSSGGRTLLQELLQEVFEKRYLVYLFQQFEAAKPILAEWLNAYLWNRPQPATAAAKPPSKPTVKVRPKLTVKAKVR